MEYTDRCFQAFITQVQIEVRQVNRHHQAFVRQDLIRQAGDIEIRVLFQRFFSESTGVEQLNC